MAVDLCIWQHSHPDCPNNNLQYCIVLTRVVPMDWKTEKTTDIITHTIVTAINGDILLIQIKIQYWIHNSPPLSWETWIHASPTHFCKIHFMIILPLRLRSSESSLLFRCLLQNALCISLLYFINTFTVPDIKLFTSGKSPWICSATVLSQVFYMWYEWPV